MDINGINSVNKNMPVKPLNKADNSHETIKKDFEASALEASGTYGSALLNKNISFGAAKQPVNGRDYVLLTPSETEEYRLDIQKRVKMMPTDIKTGLRIQNINKNNIFLYDKIISNETIYGRRFDDPEKRKEFVSRACLVAANTEQAEEAKRKLSVLNTVLADKSLTSNDKVMNVLWHVLLGVKNASTESTALKILSRDVLCNNEEFMKVVPKIVSYTSSGAESAAKAQVIDRTLSDPVFAENDGFIAGFAEILSSVKSNEGAEVKIKLLDKISEISAEKPDFIKNSAGIIATSATDYIAAVKIKLLDKIFSDDRLCENKDFMQSAIFMLEKAASPEQADQMIIFLDKMLENEELCKNKKFMQKAGYIAGNINSDNNRELAEKIISDKNLYSNETLIAHAGNVIHPASNPFRTRFAEKILSDERLYGFEPVVSNAKNIIGGIFNEEHLEAKIKVIDKVLSVPGLYNNEDFMNLLPEIIENTKNNDAADAKVKLIDSVFTDEKISKSQFGAKTFAGILSSPDLNSAYDTALTVMNDESLYNNENIANNAANIVKCSNNPVKAAATKEIIGNEHIRNDAQLLGKFLKFYIYEDYSDEKVKAALNLADLITENPERYLKKGHDSVVHILSYGTEGVNDFVGFMKKGAGFKEASDILSNFRRSAVLREHLDNPSVMRKMITSDDYNDKISKVIEGNYSEQMRTILEPDNLGFETTEILSSAFKTEDEFLTSLEKLTKSTFRQAMKKPNQYLSNIDVKYTKKINGKYPKLSDEELAQLQKKTEDFFSKNIGKMLRALKYIDTDTLNQMMDKRTNLFEKSLKDLNELTDENFELLSGLVKCKNSETGKDLTAKDKIQLCQLVETYQKSGLDFGVLKEDIKNGAVNLDAAKKVVQKRILNEAGLSDEELASVPEEMKRLNEEFSYLALNLDDEGLKQLILMMIKEAVRGNFESFIHDTSNKYGRANLETRLAFEQNGISYEKWLSPETEDVDFTVSNKKLKIKLWDRNPKEDIFIGNKTTCCTAIGSGNNESATPLYLLNTAYNVAELYDDNGNVLGMSRAFVGKLNGDNALFMDNIELNKTFTKGMSDAELVKIRDNFFKYMKNYAKEITGDENTPVYFCNADAHVPLNDLMFISGITEFTGEISEYSIYVNAANTAWVSPKSLPTENIAWRVVP